MSDTTPVDANPSAPPVTEAIDPTAAAVPATDTPPATPGADTPGDSADDRVNLGPDARIAGAAGDGGEAGEPLEAIICIPGIGDSDGTRFMDVAERMATALDNCAASAGAYFTVATRDAKTRNGAKLQSAAIVRHDTPDDADGREVLHLYEYDYRPRLGSGLEKRAPLVQAVAMAWTLAFNFPSIWLAWFGRRSKSWQQKLQVAYGSVLFFGIFLYLVLLLFAGAGVMGAKAGETTTSSTRSAQAAPTQNAPAAAAAGGERPDGAAAKAAAQPAPARQASARPGAGGGGASAKDAAGSAGSARNGVGQAVRRAWNWLPNLPAWAWTRARRAAAAVAGWFLWVSGAVIFVPLFGMLLRFNLREVLERAAPPIASAAAYLGAGRSRAEIIGELAQVINHLDENGVPGTRYAKVHLAAYSFGSVVAIDALFPNETAVNARLRRIDTLITIGCPYDFVRTYWPGYFKGREAAGSNERPRWINVYSPLDVLGSSFTDQPRGAERARLRRAAPEGRAEIRKELDRALGRGVELIECGDPIRPAFEDNLAFGQGRSGTVSFRDWVGFIGFRAHGMYWSRESSTAITCFEPVVSKLFDRRKILA